MTNIKYSKRFKLRNGEKIDFCPECDYHITDTVNNSDSVYCPKCGQQIQLFKPAVFPEKLAQDHIYSWSNAGDIVLDPFCGSGTTAKMAILSSRNFIGFEISAEYCEIANKRIASIGKDIPLFEQDLNV